MEEHRYNKIMNPLEGAQLLRMGVVDMPRTIQALIPYVPALGCFTFSLFASQGSRSAVWFVGAGIVLLIAAVILKEHRWNREREPNADDVVDWLNVKRHDWLNHIQVIMGYLSIKRYERLRAYLTHIQSEEEQESRICHLGYPPLIHYMLEHRLMKQDIVFNVHILRKFTIETEQLGERLLRTMKEIERMALKTRNAASDEAFVIRMTISPQEQEIVLCIDLPETSCLNRDEWLRLCEKVSTDHGNVYFKDEASATECTVRIS